jgi:hypothetical protein
MLEEALIGFILRHIAYIFDFITSYTEASYGNDVYLW